VPFRDIKDVPFWKIPSIIVFMCFPFRQTLADRPCGRALQSAKQKLFGAPLRAPHCRKAGTPGTLRVLFLYLLCAVSAAGIFNLEIPLSVLGNITHVYSNSLLTPTSIEISNSH
jgi:hypothetical protein